MAMPFWLKSSPCDLSTRKIRFPFDYGVFEPNGEWDGHCCFFSLVGTDVAEGEDYMLLNLPTTEAAPAEVEMEFECDPDPAITKETLANQLKDTEKVMAELGLEPKPEAWGECGSFWRQSPPGFRSIGRTSLHGDHAGSWEGGADNPGGPEHKHLHHWRLGIFVEWRRPWRSTASPNGLRSTASCWRRATQSHEVVPWHSCKRRTRGQPQNWFALIVMHHGELFPSVFSFARALLPLTWAPPRSPSSQWKDRTGN